MEQRYALVTGSSSGLGHAICLELLDLDYIVYGMSRRGAGIEHDNYIDLSADIRSEVEVAEAMSIIQDEVGGLDVLVNAAGIFTLSDLGQTPADVFLDLLQTNIQGAFHILKYSEPLLIAEETHIITISSMAAIKGFAGNSAYCASKAGLNALIDSCKQEWKKHGVRFTNILPGAIATPLWDDVKIEIPRDYLLDIEDFMHLFQMVITAPAHVHFPELHIMHKSGVME